MGKHVLSLIVLGSALLALPTSPAQARASGCGPQLEVRKGVASVVWRLCLEDGNWPHGTLTADCRIAAPFWTAVPCSVRGRFEIQRNGNLLVSGPFGAASDPKGRVAVDQIFTFACKGQGTYAFAVKDVLYFSPLLGAVAVPDSYTTLAAC
uniref:hypothetical protein n=1 Tax=Herbidospora sakaeratensis TaxID=564415 RepID=UPI0007861E94|nr:hypothetical protein [Herbidospora sakaeratensis]